ncbi:MAG: caspase family protein [Beijerinckiaceae bacterium]|nr:caspase family protein [Beijerinckiaceae bacterium]
MRVILPLLALALSSGLTAFPALAQQAEAENFGARVALVIGNATYPNASLPLTQPVDNARRVGEELRRDGFDVEIKENLNKEEMQRAFGRLYGKIKPGSVALIFFSGYGIQANKRSYMIPVDGRIYKEDEVRDDGVSLDKVLAEMNSRGASVKVAILDASLCSRYETNFRRACIGLAFPANPPGGTLIMYSAEPGSVLRSTANGRDVFVSELLKEMRVPGVAAETVFNHTCKGVVRATQGEQKPATLSSLHDDFTFGPQVIGKAEVPPSPSQAIELAPDEKSGYAQAEELGTRKGWENFINKYPSGTYAVRAREQLAKLDPPQDMDSKTIPAPQEALPRPSAKDIETIAGLDKKLEGNPEDADALYTRGTLHAKTGNFQRAVSDFNEVLKLRPMDYEALNNRCWARAMAGELQIALKDCDTAIELQPGYADALDSRGFIKLKTGQPKGALADYDAALQINQQASSLYGRGIAKRQTGDTVGADSDIAAAKGLDPSIAAEFGRSGIN